jgi:hypothetical protein
MPRAKAPLLTTRDRLSATGLMIVKFVVLS